MQIDAAGQAVHGSELGQRLAADRAKLGKPARLRHHLALQRAHCVVVGIDRRAQTLSGPAQMADKVSETPVQVLAQLEDPRRVLRHRRLAPAIGYRLEQRDQRGGRGEHDALAHGIFEQLGPLGQRRARSEEHTSELQSLAYLVCRLLLDKKKKNILTNFFLKKKHKKKHITK